MLFYNSLVIGIGCFIIYILVSVLYTIGQKKSFDRSVEVILESKGNIVNGILDDAHSSAVKVTLNSTVGKIFSNLRQIRRSAQTALAARLPKTDSFGKITPRLRL